MKKLMSLLIVMVMLTSQISVYATEDGYKEESIYGVLNEDGSTGNLNVVNGIHGSSIDYGSYKAIDNLTSLDVIEMGGDEISIPTHEGIFYYQGSLEGVELPWDFNITYTLDGQSATAEELSGVSGDLTIQIDVKKGDITKESFFDGYALQTSLALSNDLCDNIVAEGATIVEAGGSKQIAFTILPGKEAQLKVSAKVKDFEMDGITINAVKMVLGMDVDTSSFVGQISELTSAVGDLDDGAIKLLDGLTSLSKGLTQYKNGLKLYTNGMKDYADQGLALTKGLSGLSNGLVAMKEQNTALKTGVNAIESATFTQIDAQLAMNGMTLPPLTKDNYRAILGADPALAPVLTQLEQTLQLIAGLKGYMDGLGQLADGSTELSAGLDAYVDGAGKLADSAQSLYDSAVSLNNGLKDLRDGMGDYQGGTATFKEATRSMESDIDMQINTMLEEFLGKTSETVSFVSEKNKSVSSVQFFFRTSGIAKEVVEEVKIEVPKEYTFWERLLKLFGL